MCAVESRATEDGDDDNSCDNDDDDESKKEVIGGRNDKSDDGQGEEAACTQIGRNRAVGLPFSPPDAGGAM